MIEQTFLWIMLIILISIFLFIFVLLFYKPLQYYIFGKKVTIALVGRGNNENNNNELLTMGDNDNFIFYYAGIKKNVTENPVTLSFPRERTSLLIVRQSGINKTINDTVEIIDSTRKTEYILEITSNTNNKTTNVESGTTTKEQPE